MYFCHSATSVSVLFARVFSSKVTFLQMFSTTRLYRLLVNVFSLKVRVSTQMPNSAANERGRKRNGPNAENEK